MKDYVEFSNGHKMPLVGLGTWQATNPEELEVAVEEALKAGYRHFDTAYLYTNEEVLGKVFKKWIDGGKVKREDLFIVTKLPSIGMRPEHVPYFLDKSLKALKLDYVDLYLIHSPMGLQYIDDDNMWPGMETGKLLLDMTTDLEAIWKAMEEQVDKDLVKSIGISNYSASQIERIVNVARIPPASLQVELNASVQQTALQEVCKKFNITMCAYAPLGSPGRKEIYEKRGMKFEVPPLMEDPVVVDIANQHKKTPAQILLRFLIEKNIVVIPKSTNPDRLKKNFEVFDFQLKPDDVSRLDALDKGKEGRTFKMNIGGLSEHPEYATD